MKAVLGLAGSKAQGGAEIVEKPLFLVCSGAMGAYMPKLRPTAQGRHFRRLFVAVQSPRAFSIQMAGVIAMVWQSRDARNTSGWNTATTSLPAGILASMGPKASGPSEHGPYASGGYTGIPFVSI